jgi:ketosteroid isomerase-like protein
MHHEQAQANLQLVLDWVDALRRGEVDSIAQRFHPDVVWVDVTGALACEGSSQVLAWKARQTDPDTLALLDQLLKQHTDAEAAAALNTAGHRSGERKPFTARIVLHLRRDHHLPSHHDRLRARGLLTLTEIATQLGVSPGTIKAWQHAGLLPSQKANDKNERLYPPPTPGDARLVKQQGRPLSEREPIESTTGGAVRNQRLRFRRPNG